MGISLLTRSDRNTNLPIVFVVLQLTGCVGLLVILFTAWLSHDVKRGLVWTSFCASWILSCLSYALLAFAGQQGRVQPDYGLCLTQAALIYAAPPLTTGTTLALVLNLWSNVRSVVCQRAFTRDHILAIFLPYFSWLAMLGGVLVYGLQHPETVQKGIDGMYCDLNAPVPVKISSVCVVLGLAVALILEAHIIISLCRNWGVFSGNRSTLTMIARVMMFSLICAVAVVLGVIFFIPRNEGAGIELILASLPVTAVMIFGSQTDLICAWMFWRSTS